MNENSNQPYWHDRPTEPGLWLVVRRELLSKIALGDEKGAGSCVNLYTQEWIDSLVGDDNTYFGPIPFETIVQMGERLKAETQAAMVESISRTASHLGGR